MQARLKEEETRPSIVDLFKRFRHCGLIGTMGDCNRGLKKKPVPEKFNVITNGVRIKDLKAMVNLPTAIIDKCLKSRHHIHLCEKTFP